MYKCQQLPMQSGFSPMLDRYIGECIILIINIINGNKELTHGNENCNNNQMLIFGGSLKVREYLYTQITIWVNTISNQIDTRATLHTYGDFCMICRPERF
jgi:hypothetical protein